ncbi:MAG: MaoC/PaaZ C-terminal domain-containing protein, partial [Steroidobacteraceae bacterium]
MLADTPAEIQVGAEQSAAFARLSGDYNPLHLDPVAARRTSFGGTVVHGIHLLLAALDATANSWARDGLAPAGIAVTFNSPVHTGVKLRILLQDRAPENLRLIGQIGRRAAFSANITLNGSRSGDVDQADIGNNRRIAAAHCLDPVECELAAPRDVDFPPDISSAEIPLRLAPRLLSTLFPALGRLRRVGWIADLLATTRLVGMECPGANSIYSGCKLRRNDSQVGPNPLSLRYLVEQCDERFRSVRLAVTGCELSGTVDALFRPSPVAQQSLREVAERVAPDSFSGQHALVIGGSRGLGELTAKLILGGGGDVTLTYSHGRDDAEGIRTEARTLGRTCIVKHLDVRAEPLPEWVAAPFSHVYFFASPPIPRNVTGRWDHELFGRLEAVYVRAFATVAQVVLSARARTRPPVFVYPSSILLTRHENGFAEYCVAKAAGEALCDQLAYRHGAVFAHPRLPRMRTDQTSSVAAADVEDSFRVMHDLLRALRRPVPDSG